LTSLSAGIKEVWEDMTAGELSENERTYSLTNSQMMMNKSVREAADDIGLSAGQFIDWIECNQGSDYKINVDEKK
jgi:hypothetical protein